MTPRPECGSTNVIANLNLHTDETFIGHQPLNVKLVEPPPAKKPFLWIGEEVKSEFQAAVCGACGYTRLYAKSLGELSAGHQKGFESEV